MFMCVFEGRGRRACKQQRQLKSAEQEVYGVPTPSVIGDSSHQLSEQCSGSNKNDVASDLSQHKLRKLRFPVLRCSFSLKLKFLMDSWFFYTCGE